MYSRLRLLSAPTVICTQTMLVYLNVSATYENKALVNYEAYMVQSCLLVSMELWVAGHGSIGGIGDVFLIIDNETSNLVIFLVLPRQRTRELNRTTRPGWCCKRVSCSASYWPVGEGRHARIRSCLGHEAAAVHGSLVIRRRGLSLRQLLHKLHIALAAQFAVPFDVALR